MLIECIFNFLVSFFIAFIIAFPIYKIILKLKVKQPILEYVDKHNVKAGTPTMGGIIFIIAFILSSIILINGYVKIIYCCILFVVFPSCTNTPSLSEISLPSVFATISHSLIPSGISPFACFR